MIKRYSANVRPANTHLSNNQLATTPFKVWYIQIIVHIT